MACTTVKYIASLLPLRAASAGQGQNMPSECRKFRRHVHPIAMIMLTPELPDTLVPPSQCCTQQRTFPSTSQTYKTSLVVLSPTAVLSCLLSPASCPPRCSRFGCSPKEAAPASGTGLFVTLLADTDLTSERIGKRDKGFGLGDARHA